MCVSLYKKERVNLLAKKRLNEKQDMFCREFIVDYHQTKAAIRAGYSEKTSYSIGNRLLKNVEIQERIAELEKERMKRLNISQDRVLYELACIALSNGADYGEVTEKRIPGRDGEPVPVQCVDFTLTKDLNAQQRRAISSIKEGKTGIEVRTHDKVKALELLMKHYGMLSDRPESTTGDVTIINNIPRPGGDTE